MTNYSYQTSLPAYRDNGSEKLIQADLVLAYIGLGKNCLLQIADQMRLPQSTVAGRVNDLIEEGKVKYEGFVIYKDRKRKKIVLNKVFETNGQIILF